MTDWTNDKFMNSWDKTYVSTNLKDDAHPYDYSFLRGLHHELSQSPGLKSIGSEILAAASCALGRADVVGKWFDDITKDLTPEQSSELFARMREAIFCAYPFAGVPACMPACYGMIGVLERKGEAYGDTTVRRKPYMDEHDLETGRKLRAQIYASAGNSGIFSLMAKYFPEQYNTSTAFTWGYIVAKANEEAFTVNESHLLVLSTILGLGATRQMGSHIKATLGIGNSVETTKALVSVVSKFAVWAGKPFKTPNVDALVFQVKQSVNRA